MRHTEAGHADSPHAHVALSSIAAVASHVNEAMRAKETSQRMLELQNVMAGVNILRPGRVGARLWWMSIT